MSDRRRDQNSIFTFLSRGTLHAHISHLDDKGEISLVLLTVNPEQFQMLSNFKQMITGVILFEIRFYHHVSFSRD